MSECNNSKTMGHGDIARCGEIYWESNRNPQEMRDEIIKRINENIR